LETLKKNLDIIDSYTIDQILNNDVVFYIRHTYDQYKNTKLHPNEQFMVSVLKPMIDAAIEMLNYVQHNIEETLHIKTTSGGGNVQTVYNNINKAVADLNFYILHNKNDALMEKQLKKKYIIVIQKITDIINLIKAFWIRIIRKLLSKKIRFYSSNQKAQDILTFKDDNINTSFQKMHMGGKKVKRKTSKKPVNKTKV